MTGYRDYRVISIEEVIASIRKKNVFSKRKNAEAVKEGPGVCEQICPVKNHSVNILNSVSHKSRHTVLPLSVRAARGDA